MSELSAFSSTERFEVIRELGRGGMGMVYEVTDLERRSRVALKLLPEAEPAALFAFKQEFRTLADVSHPNLVGLYELFSDQSQTFFTMEVVDGVDLRSFIQGRAQADAAPSDSSAGQNTSRHAAPKADTDAAGKPGESESGPTPETPQPIIDDAFLGRLRSALRQLVNGLNVIHSLGFVHRDLKPANIMVEEDGRLVVLDFGLTMDISTRSKRAVQLAGTVAYMSPEQAQSKPLSANSDWYSVGIILYELVTGRFPFKGGWKRVLIARTKEDPDPPHWLNPAVPEDLGLLAAKLLDRNPETRAGADEILSWCGDTVGEGDVPVDAPALPVTSASFIGRTAELRQMHDDFEAARHGETVVAMIRGGSGAGKTALVNHFLASLPADARPFVLTGRCYEQESVPFKAFDSLVDMLTRILEGMRPSTLMRLLPRDVASLARIFPVINRIPAVENAPSRAATVPDQVELRRRAFTAIRELLARISDHRPLILLIDDLQWGDVDSAMLFTELLQPPDAPSMLVLGTNRIEDEQRSACLRILKNTAESQIPGVSWRHVTLAPLNHEESLQLAIGILQRTDPRAVSDAVQIADESQGIPYLLIELAQHAREGIRSDESTESRPDTPPGDDSDAMRGRLDDALWRRIELLPDEARHLLQVLSVASRPLSLTDAIAVAEMADAQASIARLRSDHFIRISVVGPDELLAPYHDRVRETILAHLTAGDLRDQHRQLATQLGASDRADARTLAIHFEGAGVAEEAARHYVLAAQVADRALAFEQVAALYQKALELRPSTGSEQFELVVGLAEALANSGRAVDAARQYLRAAELAESDQQNVNDALMLRSHAGFYFCAAGEIDEGRESLRHVLDRLGMPLPRTRTRALISLLINRVRFILRGTRVREREHVELTSEQRLNLDVTWLVACSLYIHDTIRGADYSTRNMLAALRAGEPYRIARALAWDATHAAMEGVKSAGKCERMLQRADELAERLQIPHAQGMALMGRGVSAFFLGRWREATDVCDRAVNEFTERCTGVAWELDTSNAFAFWALFWGGDFAEIQRRYPKLIAEATQRGNRMGVANLTTFAGPFAFLTQDDADGAADALARAMGNWSNLDFLVQHFTTLSAQTYIAQYRGQFSRAWQNMVTQWPQLESSFLLQVECVRVYMEHLRAACAVAAAADLRHSRSAETIHAGNRNWSVSDLEAEARKYIRALHRERASYAQPMADIVKAALLHLSDDTAGAIQLLESAHDRLNDLETRMYAAAAGFQLARLRDETTETSDVEQWIREQNVVRPDRIADLFAPGFTTTVAAVAHDAKHTNDRSL